MKIWKNELAEKLKNMKNIILPKNFDGLQGVLVKGGQMIATNLELTIISKIEGTASDETFLVPQSVIPFIENLPVGEVEIKTTKKVLTIKCGESSAKFAAPDPTQFPVPGDIDVSSGITLSAEDLKKAICGVWASSDASSTKVMAQGVYFDGDGIDLNLVASDGVRMSWATLNGTEKVDMLIPKNTLKKVLALIGDDDSVTISKSKDDKKAVIRTEGYTIQTSLLASKFMDYKSIFSTSEATTKVTVERIALIACLNRCTLCEERALPGASPSVLRILKENLNISKHNSVAEFNENVPAECVSLDDEQGMRFGFNAGNLVEALRTFDSEKVELHYTGELKPMLITAPESKLKHLIVPMKLIGEK